MNAPVRKPLILTLNLFLIIISSVLLNSFLTYSSYTIEKNGNWLSSKTKLKAVNGVYAYMFTKVALCENHLDLGAWWGNQELIYKQSLNWDSISFSYLSSHNTFSVFLHKSDTLTTGISFNDTICTLFTADTEGKFISKQVFSAREKDCWNTVVITRNSDSVSLFINNQRYLHTALSLPANTNIGFRGGWYQVIIDNISVYDSCHKLLVDESFTPLFELHWQTFAFILLSVILLLVIYNSAYQSWLTPVNISLLLGFVACYAVYYYHLSHLYPVDADLIDWHGHTVNFDFEKTVCKRLETQYPAVKDKPVILFIGSSQTWGAGASSSNHSYPALVERKLRNHFQDSSITVINAGICGAKSDMLYKHYSTEWYRFKPILTVIDLSHNDNVDSAMFRLYIQRFLDFNRANHIRTLLIAEPHFTTVNPLEPNQIIIKDEGTRFKVNTIDMQTFLDSCSSQGFIWWDFVHMTDYGYRLFSERITPVVIFELEKDSLLLKSKAVSKQE